jgi:hypothetical protein
LLPVLYEKKKLANISNNTQENTILIEILSEFLSLETQRFYDSLSKQSKKRTK